MCLFLGNLKDMYCYNTAFVNIDSIHMVYIYTRYRCINAFIYR